MIDKEHLEFLIGIGHNVSEIAKKGLHGGVMHRNTLTNFMRKNGIKSPKERYTSLQDSEIKIIIREITRLFPNSGIREVDSMLKTRNPPVIVQRDKVQRLMSEINQLQLLDDGLKSSQGGNTVYQYQIPCGILIPTIV